MAITYAELKEKQSENTDAVAEAILAIHGGMGLRNFQFHESGLDLTGLSDADQAKIKSLVETGNSDDTPVVTAESLAKKHTQKELSQQAKESGLDGNTSTNKTELAQAILDRRSELDRQAIAPQPAE